MNAKQELEAVFTVVLGKTMTAQDSTALYNFIWFLPIGPFIPANQLKELLIILKHGAMTSFRPKGYHSSAWDMGKVVSINPCGELVISPLTSKK